MKLFLSYSVSSCGGAARGFGNTEASVDHEPYGIEDVRFLERMIEDDLRGKGVKSPDVKMLSWKAM